jgi:hypothetical protein
VSKKLVSDDKIKPGEQNFQQDFQKVNDPDDKDDVSL